MQNSKAINIKKIVLINLPEEGQCRDFYTPKYAIDSFSVYPPLGLLYVAMGVKDFYDVKVIDVVALGYSIKQVAEKIIEQMPEVLGISCQTFRIYPMVEIIKEVKLKLPNIIVVVGGPHTHLYPEETINLPGVDYVIMSDGDVSFKKLMDALASGTKNELKIYLVWYLKIKA